MPCFCLKNCGLYILSITVCHRYIVFLEKCNDIELKESLGYVRSNLLWKLKKYKQSAKPTVVNYSCK